MAILRLDVHWILTWCVDRNRNLEFGTWTWDCQPIWICFNPFTAKGDTYLYQFLLAGMVVKGMMKLMMFKIHEINYGHSDQCIVWHHNISIIALVQPINFVYIINGDFLDWVGLKFFSANAFNAKINRVSAPILCLEFLKLAEIHDVLCDPNYNIMSFASNNLAAAMSCKAETISIFALSTSCSR